MNKAASGVGYLHTDPMPKALQNSFKNIRKEDTPLQNAMYAYNTATIDTQSALTRWTYPVALVPVKQGVILIQRATAQAVRLALSQLASPPDKGKRALPYLQQIAYPETGKNLGEFINKTKKDKLIYILPTTDSPHINETLKSYYSYANSWNHNEKWSKIKYYQDSNAWRLFIEK